MFREHGEGGAWWEGLGEEDWGAWWEGLGEEAKIKSFLFNFSDE